MMKAWEAKATKRAANATGFTLMAVSLAACNDDAADAVLSVTAVDAQLPAFAGETKEALVDAIKTSNDAEIAAAVDVTSNDADAILAAVTDVDATATSVAEVASNAAAAVDVTSNDADAILAAVTDVDATATSVADVATNAAAAVDITSDNPTAVSLALRDAAATLGVTGTSTMSDAELITAIKTQNDATVMVSNDSAVVTAALVDAAEAAGVTGTATMTDAQLIAALTTSNDASAIDAAVDALGYGDDIDTLAELAAAYDALANTSVTSFTLTTDGGVVTGTSGNDTFIAPSESLDVSVIQGLEGTDTLKATLRAADNNTVVTSSGVEEFYLRDTAGTTLDMADAAGVTQVWSDRSTAALTIEGISTDVTVGINKTDQNYTVTFDGVTGTADAISVALSESEGGTFTADGVETFNVATSGSDGSDVTLDGDALTAVNVSGAQDADIGAMATTVETVVASALTGALTVSVSAAIAAGTDVNVTGGDGDDVITAAGVTADDTIDGGAGNDELVVDDAISAANVVNISNFETISFDYTGAGITVDADNTADAEDIKFYVEDTDTITVNDVASSGNSIVISSRDLDLADGTDDVTGAIALNAKEDATGDSVSLDLQYDDTSTTTPAEGDDFATGAITANDADTLNLLTSTAAASGISDVITVETLNATDATTVNITGDTDLTLGGTTFDVADDEVTVNASAFTGVLTLTVDDEELDGMSGGLIGGAGSEDSLTVGMLDVDVDAVQSPVSGFESVTIQLGVTNATVEANLLNLGADDYTVDLNAYADGNGQATISGVANGSDLEIVGATAATTDVLNVEGAGSSSSMTISLSDEGNDFTGILNIARTGTVTIDTTSDTAQAHDIEDLQTAASVETLNVTGADNLTISTALDNDVTTLGFDGFEGTFIGEVGTGGVTINLSGDMTVGADITILVDTGGNPGEFVVDGTAIAAANSLTLGTGTDKVVFDATSDNDVLISGFTAGIAGDTLDMSALGITGFADLTFTDFDNLSDAATAGDDFVAADSVRITSSDFDGEIYLAGVTTSDLDAANFIFA